MADSSSDVSERLGLHIVVLRFDRRPAPTPAAFAILMAHGDPDHRLHTGAEPKAPVLADYPPFSSANTSEYPRKDVMTAAIPRQA